MFQSLLFALVVGTVPPPDSMSSRIQVDFQSPERNGSVQMDLYADRKKGMRLEIGAFGFTVASGLWTDTSWQLIQSMENRVLVGHEDWMPLGDPIHTPRIKPLEFLPILWGDTSRLGLLFQPSLMDTSKLIGSYTLGPMENCRDTLKCPKWVEFHQGSSRLRLEVIKRDFKPKWNNKIWILTLPNDLPVFRLPPLDSLKAEAADLKLIEH